MSYYGYRPSARFPQHRRKKRKEMEDSIAESNQHKQSESILLLGVGSQAILYPCRVPIPTSGNDGSTDVTGVLYLYITLFITHFNLFEDAYIIKLFDRSVDLAQFSTSTPLYPICRAWMRNNPTVRDQSASPSPPQNMSDDEVSSFFFSFLVLILVNCTDSIAYVLKKTTTDKQVFCLAVLPTFL